MDVNSDEDGDDELNHPVEFVQAEHDFLPVGNPTYLSFVRNNIIKVYNKDPSGWWDGELEGRRGWFPRSVHDVPERPGDERGGAPAAARVTRERTS